MKKMLGIICPYIILIIVYAVNIAHFEYDLLIKSFIVGLLIGIWYYCISSSEGSKAMIIAMIMNIIIFIVGIIAIEMIVELEFLQDIISIMCMFIGLECVALYIINQNQPRLSMTYKYSYKNKRRRYF